MVAQPDSYITLRDVRAGGSLPPPLPGLWLTDAATYVPVPQLVHGVLPAGGLAAIAGPPGSGKSTFTIDLALHVAAGKAWRGRRVTGGTVVYCGLEGSAGLQCRLAAAIRRDPDLELGKLRLVTGTVHLLDDLERLLATAAEVAEVGAVALIVIDTLARAIPGLDENSFRDISQALQALDRLRIETGATVLVVHHTGKDGTKGMRGHSAILGAVDAELIVTGTSGVRTAELTKSRDSDSGARLAFALEPVPVGVDAYGEAVTACVVRPCDPPAEARKVPQGTNVAKLWSALTEWHRTHDGGLATRGDLKALAKAQGISQANRLTEAIQGLERHGYLTPSVGGWTVNPDA